MITREAPEIFKYKEVDGKLIGIDKDMNIIVLARLVPPIETGASIPQPAPTQKKRGPSKPKAPIALAPEPIQNSTDSLN